VLATSIAFIATPVGAVIIAIAAAVAGVIVVWKNWGTIVDFFKEQLNKVITLINDKFIGSVNNMIEIMNKVPWVEIGYIDKIKTFETKVDDVAEAIKETSKTVVDDAIPSFEGLKDLVDMSAQQMAALEKGIESLKKPVTEEDKAQDRLSKITERLGLKTGALNAEVQALVDTGFFNLQEALTEISRKYEGQFAESQQRAKNGLVLFNKELERQRLEAELGAEALDKLIVAMKQANAAAGGGSVAPRYDASMTPADLTPEKLAEQTGISIAAARKQLEDFPQFATGITNNVSVTVNATTGASADEIAKKAATEVSSALGSSAVSSENTRSS
jgi:predicted transcriptional regulator